MSPFAASFSLPLHLEAGHEVLAQSENWSAITAPAFLGFYALVDLLLVGVMLTLFAARWRAVTR